MGTMSAGEARGKPNAGQVADAEAGSHTVTRSLSWS